MSSHSPSTSPESSGSEDLFDRWLDAALAGDIQEPEEYCAQHAAGPELLIALQRVAAQLAGANIDNQARPDSLRPLADDDLPYDSLGEFRLVRRLGEGGMGTVFLAEQPSLDRLVALKVMRADSLLSPTAQQRFDLEARAVARLRHPHVVTMFGSGEDRGVRYLVMELVPGQSLDEVLAETTRSDQLVRWCHEIGSALASAHAEGILHRDVKPSNIRIDPNQRAVLLDFGLARDLLDDGPARTIQFAGSPHYASPEQRRGDRNSIDHRTDIYSLGVVLYEGLTGRLPFSGSTLEAIAQEALTHDPVPVRKHNPRIPQDLAIVIAKAMETAPTDRYATMQAFVDDLSAVLELRPIAAIAPSRWARSVRWCRRHRGVVITASLMAIALLAVVGLWARQMFVDANERHQESARLIQEASDELDTYRKRRHEFALAADSAFQLNVASRQRYLDPNENAFLQLHSVNREIHWASTDKLFASMGEKLRAAEQLTPDADVDKIWARFWYERWADHRTAKDWRALLGFAEDQVTRHDPTGETKNLIFGGTTISVVSDPEGAEVHLFQSMEAADIGRSDPLEWLSELPGDRRMTKVPWPGENSLIGTGPVTDIPIVRGEFIIELRMPGHETVVLPVVVPYRSPDNPLHREYAGRMLPTGTTPKGFARVSDARGRWPGVFMQNREVTCAEYLEFLNQQRGRGTVAQPPRPLGRLAWPQGTAGNYELPDPAMAEQPVVGVSWHDASAYASWWNEHHELQVLDVRYVARLPTRKEWRRAAGAVNTNAFREYTFGNYFSPHWCKGRFAKPNSGLEPVMSYPHDVSLYGVYDMAGSAAEWCTAFLDKGLTLRPLCGGSWQDSVAESFRIDAVRGLTAGAAGLHTGFRMVWAPR